MIIPYSFICFDLPLSLLSWTFFTHIPLIFLSTFLISAIQSSRCHQKTVLKLLVIHIKINNYSSSKNKMYTSSHGTQNIKNLSNLFFFFSSVSFIVTPFSITPPLHRLFQFEGWINHSLLWTALFMHSCDLGIGWCLPALRYFGSFIIVLNYSFLLSVKKIKCFGYTEFRPGCVTCLTNETWADVTFPCRSFKSHDIILFLLPWEQHVPLKGCFLSLDNRMKSCCTELKWTHTQYETQARLPLQTIQQK